MGMGKYILKRLGFMIFVILGISIMVFLLTHVVGNPVDHLLPLTASEEQKLAKTQELGLDQPILVQLGEYLKSLVRLDFGNSWKQLLPNMEVIAKFVPPTLFLVSLSCLLALLVGVPLGILAAYRPGSLLDRIVTSTSLIGICLPPFWVGLVLMLIFSVNLRWLPTSGSGTWAHVILPMVALALNPGGHVVQIVRNEMVEQLDSLYAITARAKGASETALLFKHALKNVMSATVTILGVDYLALLAGGSSTVEVVFGWPGFGSLITDTISSMDFPLLQAQVFIVALFVCVVNLLIDFLYAAIDPRIRY